VQCAYLSVREEVSQPAAEALEQHAELLEPQRAPRAVGAQQQALGHLVARVVEEREQQGRANLGAEHAGQQVSREAGGAAAENGRTCQS
jgi:hypothetical protein